MSVMGILAAAAATVGVLGGLWARSRKQRQHPGHCSRCGSARVLLDEETEDAHLDEGQRHEERLGTADYDVWWCEACEQGVVVRHALQATERRVDCEKCGHAAAQEVIRTLNPATHAQGGEFQIRLSCGGCGHTQQFWRYTPRLRAP